MMVSKLERQGSTVCFYGCTKYSDVLSTLCQRKKEAFIGLGKLGTETFSVKSLLGDGMYKERAGKLHFLKTTNLLYIVRYKLRA